MSNRFTVIPLMNTTLEVVFGSGKFKITVEKHEPFSRITFEMTEKEMRDFQEIMVILQNGMDAFRK